MRFSSIVLLSLACSPAFADSKAEARQHVERAGVAHKEGRYADALTELEIAYALDPQPAFLYAIGQVHVMQGACDKAISFYERFIAAGPGESQIAKAREAIDTCKQLRPDPKPVEPAKPEPVKPEPVKSEPVEPPPPPTASPWYTDVLGDVLVIGGVAAGATGGYFLRSAHRDRDRADTAADYQTHDDLVHRAERKQLYAAAFAIGGGVLLTAGVLRYVLRDSGGERAAIAVTPAEGGGMVTWGARF